MINFNIHSTPVAWQFIQSWIKSKQRSYSKTIDLLPKQKHGPIFIQLVACFKVPVHAHKASQNHNTLKSCFKVTPLKSAGKVL